MTQLPTVGSPDDVFYTEPPFPDLAGYVVVKQNPDGSWPERPDVERVSYWARNPNLVFDPWAADAASPDIRPEEEWR